MGVSIYYANSQTYTDYTKLCDLHENVAFSEVLDEVGEFSFTYPLADPNCQELDTSKSVIITDGYEFIAGQIMSVERVFVGSELMMQVKGQSWLFEFASQVTKPNQAFNNELLDSILNPSNANGLIPQVPPPFVGPSQWTSIRNFDTSTERFNYLASLQSFMEVLMKIKDTRGISSTNNTGIHFRYDGNITDQKRIVFFYAGVNNDSVRILSCPTGNCGTPDDVAFIESLDEFENSFDIVNKVYLIGGADDSGMNQLTGRDVTVMDINFLVIPETGANTDNVPYDSSVYSNTKTAPNTNTSYYIQDDYSVSLYGLREGSFSAKDLMPLTSNGEDFTNTDRQVAANALYDRALKFLNDKSFPPLSYKLALSGKGCRLIEVGDSVRLKYKGKVNKNCANGQTVCVFKEIDAYLFVLKKNVTWVNGEAQYQFEFSSRVEKVASDVDVVQSLASSQEQYQKQRQGSTTNFSYMFKDNGTSSYSPTLTIRFPKKTLYWDYVKMWVRINPFVCSNCPAGTMTQLNSLIPTTITIQIDGTPIDTISGIIYSNPFKYPSDCDGLDLMKLADDAGILTSLLTTCDHTIKFILSNNACNIEADVEASLYLSSQ